MCYSQHGSSSFHLRLFLSFPLFPLFPKLMQESDTKLIKKAHGKDALEAGNFTSLQAAFYRNPMLSPDASVQTTLGRRVQ